MARTVPSQAAGDAPATIHVESAFPAHGAVPARHTCDGEDESPPVAWRGIPGATIEIALTLEDPDAPDETFVHWMVAGIDSASLGLDAATLPEGVVQGHNDFGDVGYGGPCPPEDHAPHRYVFTVFAASAGLGLEDGFTAEQLHAALDGQVIAKGELVGLYRQRQEEESGG